VANEMWPTPTAGDSKASGSAGYSTDSGRHSGTTLTDATVRQWPTTTAADVKGPNPPRLRAKGNDDLPTVVRQWLTPSARDWRDGRASPETMQRNARPLNETVVMEWGTPRCGDGMLQRLRPHLEDARGRLEDQVSIAGQPDEEPTSTRGRSHVRLNPRWTLQLMGFPPDWCDLDNETLSELRATRSCRKSPR